MVHYVKGAKSWGKMDVNQNVSHDTDIINTKHFKGIFSQVRTYKVEKKWASF